MISRIQTTILPNSVSMANGQSIISALDWSMEDTGATLYPELRILRSIGRSLAMMPGKQDVYLRYTDPPDRFTGERAAHNLRFARGTGEIEEVELPGEQ